MKKNIATLKEYFQAGRKPTQEQFADLIDSFVHKDTIKVIPSEQFQIYKHPNNTNQEQLEPQDMVLGWLDSQTFLANAIYVGGDPLEATSYNAIMPIKPFITED